MAGDKKPLTPHELKIMKIVWKLGRATVRDVYETLREQRKIAYTTVMTTMKVLEEKKHLKRRLRGRAHLYEPARPRHQVIGAMVQEFVDRVFNGSAQPLLLHLVQGNQISEKDLDQLRKLLREGD